MIEDHDLRVMKEESLREQEREREDPIREINKIAAEMGLGFQRTSSRKRNRLLLFPVPKDWKGIRFHFGYDAWRQPDGKFNAYKYRENKEKKSLTIVNRLGFAKRKTAKKRAWQWYEKYYRDPERLAAQERKMAAKRSKPKPTKLQLAEAKLLRIQSNIKKMETKKKRLDTLLKKRRKSAKYVSRRIEKLKEQI